jgi:hypothetical protein
MALIELVCEDFIDISYDPEESWLHVNWKGYQSVDSVQQGCERMLELLAEYHADRVLNDNTNVLGIWRGAAEWLAVDWFPRMQQAGLKCFAWVYSPSRFSQVSTDMTLSLMDPEAMNVHVFYDRADAASWLRTCIDTK